MEEKKVKELWWEGADLCITTEDGKTMKYVNAKLVKTPYDDMEGVTEITVTVQEGNG